MFKPPTLSFLYLFSSVLMHASSNLPLYVLRDDLFERREGRRLETRSFSVFLLFVVLFSFFVPLARVKLRGLLFVVRLGMFGLFFKLVSRKKKTADGLFENDKNNERKIQKMILKGGNRDNYQIKQIQLYHWYF